MTCYKQKKKFKMLIEFLRKDGRVVEGVALEMLCKYLFYRGFESLSFRHISLLNDEFEIHKIEFIYCCNN